MFAPALLLGALSCGEHAESPVAPEVTPALATAAAGALSFRQVSVGGEHTCALTSDDRAYCWGYNLWGQLGNGTTDGPEICNTHPCSSRPVEVLGGLRFRHLSAGHQFTCGITTDSRAYCWGRNYEGELGIGTISPFSLEPVEVPGRRFNLVRAGDSHACALTPTHAAFCWGSNGWGQLGDGTKTDRPGPVRVAGGLAWRQLSGGTIHTCGVTTDDHAYCWGGNGGGALGDGTKTQRLKPFAVSGGRLFRQIETGPGHTCAVAATDDRAYCWGSSGSGALGDGTTVVTRLSPTAVAGQRRFDHVNAGTDHTCGVTMAGRGFCWGANPAGQLGDGTTSSRRRPTALSVDLPLAQVSAGIGFSCGVTTDDRAYCWGDGFYGQLGDGTTGFHSDPTPVAGTS